MWLIDLADFLRLGDLTFSAQQVRPIISAVFGSNWLTESLEFTPRWGHGATFNSGYLYIFG